MIIRWQKPYTSLYPALRLFSSHSKALSLHVHRTPCCHDAGFRVRVQRARVSEGPQLQSFGLKVRGSGLRVWNLWGSGVGELRASSVNVRAIDQSYTL